MNTNTIIYTIVQNSTNKVVFCTDNEYHYAQFILKHFPKNSYEYDSSMEMLKLTSKNFTMTMSRLDEDCF